MAATPTGAGSNRLEALQAIEANRMESLKDDLRRGDQDPAILDAPEELKTTEAELPVGDTEALEAEAPEAPETPEPPPERPKVKIKVDGQEMEVDEDKIREEGIKSLQKEIAADKRLEEASRIKKQMEDAWQAAQKQAQVPPVQTTAPSQDGQAGADDFFIQAVKKIQYGSETEAAEAMKTLVSQAAQAGRPRELTLQQVQDFIDFREATKWAFDEYKDLLSDPVLRTAFAESERALRAKGDSRPYREIYQEIGTGLRGWLKDKIPAPSPQTKVERKASVVNIPSAATRQQAPQPQKEPTPTDVIAEMRKARKQG